MDSEKVALVLDELLTGDRLMMNVNPKRLAEVLTKYRELYPTDTRPFSEMSSDIQHAIIRVAKD